MTDANGSMLALLEKSRVFRVSCEGDGTFEFTEACDGYFYELLTRDQVMKLADELRELANACTKEG